MWRSSLAVGRFSILVALILGFSTLLTGCGGKANTNVKGKVTYKSKPVVWGSVTLLSEDGMAHQGQIDLEGNYEIKNVPVGNVKVGVHSPNPEERRASGGGTAPGKGGKGDFEDPREAAGFKQDKGPDMPKPPKGAWVALPQQYMDAMNSGLTAQVAPGKPLNIDLK